MTDTLESIIARVIDAGQRMTCDCTCGERMVGHKVDCGLPALQEAIEELELAALPRASAQAVAQPSVQDAVARPAIEILFYSDLHGWQFQILDASQLFPGTKLYTHPAPSIPAGWSIGMTDSPHGDVILCGPEGNAQLIRNDPAERTYQPLVFRFLSALIAAAPSHPQPLTLDPAKHAKILQPTDNSMGLDNE